MSFPTPHLLASPEQIGDLTGGRSYERWENEGGALVRRSSELAVPPAGSLRFAGGRTVTQDEQDRLAARARPA